MSTELKKYQVNGEMVWLGNINKVDGIKLDKPIHYHIRPLNIKDAEAMGKLSETIYANLSKGQECFIHKHSKEYYNSVFKNRNIRYIGAFVGKELIGMSYIKICENNEDLQEELPNCEYNFFDKRRNANSRIATFGADSVHPSYRGNAINTAMINYRMEQASLLNCTDCASIVDRNNRWNMTPYFACRFNLFQTSVDPSDGGKISLLHKPMGKSSVLSDVKTRITLPYDRFELIDAMIKKGFIGVEFDKKTAEITFAHSNYYNTNIYSFDLALIYQKNHTFAI